MTTTTVISPSQLTPESYAPFGDVIAARADVTPVDANMNTAKRYDRLTELKNLRPGKAALNVSVFRCQPRAPSQTGGIEIRLLERHARSTQLFIPMGNVTRYLVIVAPEGGRPDPASIKAFIADGRQGITYKPGTWHHPLIALDRESDFTCAVHEDGSTGDCETRDLDRPVVVKITP